MRNFIINYNNNINGKRNTSVFIANKIVKEVVNNYPKAYYIDFNDILCNESSCIYKEGNNSIYTTDGSHLSIYGSNYIGEHYTKGNIDRVFYKIKKLYRENLKDTFTKNINEILRNN